MTPTELGPEARNLRGKTCDCALNILQDVAREQTG